MKKILTYIVAILVVVVGIWWLMGHDAKAPVETASPSVSVSASASPTATPTAQPNLTITSPKDGALLSSPITVTGMARIFENQFMVAATTMDGHVIVQNHVMSDAKDSGLFGKYTTTLTMPAGAPADFKIVAYAPSAKGDGTYEGYAEISVHLKTILIQVQQ